MESVPRNVIIDLLPTYIAGEASEETKSLVEKYAEKDPEIAELIQTGKLDPDPVSPEIELPDNLEMKTINRVRRSIRLKILYVAFATAAILMAPLIAMQFTEEVNWGLLDFVVMGFLLFGTGFAYVMISRISEKVMYKAAVAVAVLGGFLLIWVNLAVGIIGAEGNPANLLYFGVICVGIIGAVLSHFRPAGMASTMFATALAQMLVPIIALIFWGNNTEQIGDPVFLFGVSAFFAIFFLISASLFRSVAKKKQ